MRMKNGAKKISKADLEAKGIQVVMETEGDLDIEGILITEEQKKCWDNILTIEIERQRKEHARRTKEGMKNKGVTPGRLPISLDLQNEIIEMRKRGFTVTKIVWVLKEKGEYVSESTVKKYCKSLRKKKEGTYNEINDEEII